jgi:hypothetical protein
MAVLYIIVRSFGCQHTGRGQLVLISKYFRCAASEYYTLCRFTRLPSQHRIDELSLTFSGNVLCMSRNALVFVSSDWRHAVNLPGVFKTATVSILCTDIYQLIAPLCRGE